MAWKSEEMYLGLSQFDSESDSEPSISWSSRCDTAWIINLYNEFGGRFLAMVISIEHIASGVVGTLLWQTTPYLWRSYHVPAQQAAAFLNFAYLPWVSKPVIALLSDVLPVAGYNKSPYMKLSAVLGLASLLVLGFSSPETLPVKAAACCVLLVQYFLATNDIMMEATASKFIREKPEIGPDLLTFFYAGCQLLSLFAALGSGFLLDELSPQRISLVVAVMAIIAMIPLFLGFLGEKRQTAEEISVTRQKFGNQWEITMLAVVISAGNLISATLALISLNPVVNAASQCTVAVVVLLSFSLTLSPPLAKFTAFTLLQTSLSPPLGSAPYYFVTDTEEQFPGGPHFTKFFFNSVMGAAGILCSILGLLVYRRFSKGIPYNMVLLGANVASALLHMADAVMFSRLNLRLGIPDRVFALGYAVLSQVIYQWQWVPQAALISQFCPKGMEATVYALAVGCHNTGYSVANALGALVLHLFDCNPRGLPNEGEQFRNLWLCSVVTGALPLLASAAIFWLVPNTKPGESLGHSLHTTEGSMWKRCSNMEDSENNEEDSELKERSQTPLLHL